MIASDIRVWRDAFDFHRNNSRDMTLMDDQGMRIWARSSFTILIGGHQILETQIISPKQRKPATNNI